MFWTRGFIGTLAFSTLGWPHETEDLKYFYPTDVLVTGYDIIFFWVIRMVFSALEVTASHPLNIPSFMAW